MGSPALAPTWDDVNFGSFAPASRLARDFEAWQQPRQPHAIASGSAASLAQPKLPLSVRIAVIGGGALIGWATPIALAITLLR